MKKAKKLATIVLSLALAVSITACGGGNGGGSAAPAPASVTPAAPAAGETPATAEPAAQGLRIGIVTSSGVDDGSFGQDCYNGILTFLADHPESTVNAVTEPDIGKILQAAADVIADYDVLVLPGFQFAGIGAIAADNPDRYVILVDSGPTDAEGNSIELPNVYAMTFREQESGFLAGVAAALETETGKVAVVNGIAFPSNVNYQWGFMSGVNYANKHLGASAEIVELASYAGTDVTGANVGGNYVGAFADEPTGKVVGAALLERGVDIMLVAAGASGNGVFTAIKEAPSGFAIGCDVDQFDDGAIAGRNMILTSALKVMNTNVTAQLKALNDGVFQGQNAVLGADTNSTGLVLTQGRHQLSGDTVKAINEVYPLLRDGAIVPAANFNGHSPDNFPGL